MARREPTTAERIEWIKDCLTRVARERKAEDIRQSDWDRVRDLMSAAKQCLELARDLSEPGYLRAISEDARADLEESGAGG